MKIKSKVWLEEGGVLVFGGGKAGILRAVEKTGSLSGAARELGMSYRHTWSSIRAVELRLGRQLLVRQRGGAKRGGAVLTDFARELLTTFETLDREVRCYADRRFEAQTQKRKR